MPRRTYTLPNGRAEDDAFETWRRLRLARGESVTAIELYELVARWSDDRLAYTEAKGETIGRLIEAAEVWARQAGWSLPAALCEELPEGTDQEDRDG